MLIFDVDFSYKDENNELRFSCQEVECGNPEKIKEYLLKEGYKGVNVIAYWQKN